MIICSPITYFISLILSVEKFLKKSSLRVVSNSLVNIFSVVFSTLLNPKLYLST